MIVSPNLRWNHILFYTWKSMLYFLLLSIAVYVLHVSLGANKAFTVPFNAVATLSTALAIFLGFNNNSSYDRWWEARKIWGLLVNYSRVWAREVLTLAQEENGAADSEALRTWKRKMLDRHLAFTHALRVFLRKPNGYNANDNEVIETNNTYSDIKKFISIEECDIVLSKRNPPNQLLLHQGEDLREAYERGWLSDYRFVKLQETLSEFNNHQGMCERIKNTPFPRPYSYFSRVFVYLHGTLVPFAFIEQLGVLNIPLALIINFIFLMLDVVGERLADPFENRLEDTPLTSICLTIEENVKEMAGVGELPVMPKPVHGVVF